MPNFCINMSLTNYNQKDGEVHLEVTRGQDTHVECKPFTTKMTDDQITFYLSLKRESMFIAFKEAKLIGASLLSLKDVREHLGL